MPQSRGPGQQPEGDLCRQGVWVDRLSEIQPSEGVIEPVSVIRRRRIGVRRGAQCCAAIAFVLAIAGASEAGTLRLAWNPSADPGNSYFLFYGTEPGVYTNVINVGPATSWTVPGLAGGQLYYFAVEALDSLGAGSPLSSVVSGTTTNQPPSIVNPGNQIN